MIVPSKHCSNYLLHSFGNVSVKTIMCLTCYVRSNICSRAIREARDAPFMIFLGSVLSFVIDSLWVILNLMACERRSEEGTCGREGTPTVAGVKDERSAHVEPKGMRAQRSDRRSPHKRLQSRSSRPWLDSKVPIMSCQKTKTGHWHSTIKQIISSWGNRKC